jgi:hypothetical protein
MEARARASEAAPMHTCSRRALLVALAAILVPASPAAAAPVRGTFVAALDDRPALHLGLVTDGRRVAAYVCDNGRRSVWFDGRFRGNTATLRARGRRGTIRLRSRGTALSGVVRLAGRTLRFRALRARGRAGIWRASVSAADGGAVEATWIVLRNGRQTGAVVDGTNIERPPALNTAQPDVQLADQDLTAVELGPIQLFPFAVSPQVVTIPASSGPQSRPSQASITITRDGIADVSGVQVRIDGQLRPPRPRQPGSDRIVVDLPSGIGAGLHDVSVQIPGQPLLVRDDAFRVVLERATP